MRKKRQPVSRRPAQVTQALYLLSGSLVLGMVLTLLDVGELSASTLWVLHAVALIVAMSVLLIYEISRGKNWARFVFLALFIVGLVPYLPDTMVMFDQSPIMGSLSVLQLVVQLIALYLVFTSASSAWFRKKSVVNLGKKVRFGRRLSHSFG